MAKGINPNTGKPTSRYDLCHTAKQRKLQNAADRLLAKSGYFAADTEQSIAQDEISVDADAIGKNGQLKPTWVGRA